jgi:putative ABC transport system permease protein
VSLLIGALTIGFILSLLALGVFVSFRIFAFPDITAEGSITLGAAITAALLVDGWSPLAATVVAVAGGALAGMSTAILHTRFKINGLLSGILVMTSLYSINLHVMGRSNIPLLSARTFMNQADDAGHFLFGVRQAVDVLGWEVSARDLAVLLFSALAAVVAGIVMYIFFRTDLGTSMRATGDNSQMIRALGVNDGNMIVLGLGLSNGMIALSGALLAQYQGFSDVQMGIGMLVWGLASVIIGEALVGVRQMGYAITGAVMGSVLFRLMVAIVLRWGLNPNDLKLITALFVFVALILPGVLAKARMRKTAAVTSA